MKPDTESNKRVETDAQEMRVSPACYFLKGGTVERQHIKGGKIRRELLSSIKSRINAGEERQAIFNDLSTKYVEQDWLASFIASAPNPDDIQKLKKGTSFIFISLCVYAAIHIVSIILNLSPLIAENKKLLFVLPMTFFWPAIAIWCAVQVRGCQGASYRIAGFITLILTLNILRGFFDKSVDVDLSLILPGVVMLMLAVSSFIAFKIRKSYFPHIGYFGVKKENGVYVLNRS